MGAVPVPVPAGAIWSPPDVKGVRGYSGKRPWRFHHPPLDKAAWRRALRAARRTYVTGLEASGGLERATQSAASHARAQMTHASVVALYRAVGSELDPEQLGAWLHRRGTILALPRLRAKSPDMEFVRWEPAQPLRRGPHGIDQPHDDMPLVEPDLIVAPLLGFERAGTRLGQGLGCYDRVFSAFPAARRVGYGWGMQQADALPRDPWDRPLHAMVTECEGFTCGTAS